MKREEEISLPLISPHQALSLYISWWDSSQALAAINPPPRASFVSFSLSLKHLFSLFPTLSLSLSHHRRPTVAVRSTTMAVKGATCATTTTLEGAKGSRVCSMEANSWLWQCVQCTWPSRGFLDCTTVSSHLHCYFWVLINSSCLLITMVHSIRDESALIFDTYFRAK